MRTFYTANDIEDLAASGVKQLELVPTIMLTAAARERAEELHIALVTPGGKGSTPATQSATPGLAPKASVLPAKPRGCQHGTLGTASGSSAPSSQMVDQLVDAVSALKKRGG